MDENLNQQPTAEELQEEEIALKDSKEEEIRSSVIEKYGLDETDNAELIEKLTKDIIAQQKSFSKVVSQKRSWREKVLKPETKKGDEKLQPKSTEDVEKMMEEKFFNRDLDELDVSDNLKDEIKKVCKVNNIGVRKALKDPYIVFLQKQESDEKELDKSIISESKKNGKVIKIDTTKALNPDDFDMSTKEGRDAWDKAKAKKKQS